MNLLALDPKPGKGKILDGLWGKKKGIFYHVRFHKKMSCTHILLHKWNSTNIAALITFVTILFVCLDPFLLLYEAYMRRIPHICQKYPKKTKEKSNPTKPPKAL